MATFPTAAAKPHATRIRYLIVLVTTLMAVMLYLHRFSLAFAVGYIREDLALTGGQVALVLSAFQLGYAVGQVPAGWFGDLWGARIMLSLYILAWSVVTGFMGLAAGFGAVLALRVGCGLAQAGAYPVSAGLLSRWVPFSARAFASAVVSVGGRLGGAIAPILTGYLILAFVPADAPALLQPGDLLDPPALCRRLAAADQQDDSHFARRLLDRLPSPAAKIVGDLAATPPGTQATPGQVDVLVAGLNQALRDRTLCVSGELPDLKVEAEARRLAERPRETLSESQVERLNRLILEGIYPGQVKKLYGAGWRPVMWVFGAAGVLVAGLFWLVFRNRPEEHPLANAAEVALIESSRPRTVTSAQGRAGALPLRAIVGNRSLWMSSISQFATNFGWFFLGTWMPDYLDRVHEVPVVERGWMAGVPMAVGMIGMLTGGWVTDRLTRHLGVRWGRGLPMSLTRFVAMAAFIACVFVPSPWLAVAAFSLVAVAVDLGTSAVWAYMQDVGGVYVGSVLGWGNMWGAFGAFVSPLVLRAAIDFPGLGWNGAFLILAGAFLISGVAALGVDARSPVVLRTEPALP